MPVLLISPIRLIAATVFLVVISGGAVVSVRSDAGSPNGDPPRPDFSRQVRPILSDHCFACHGPDSEQRKGGLRLDTAEGLSGVIEPGVVDASPLLDRIATDDPDERMPPPHFNKPLTAEQQEILVRWVASGAEFAQHWAFVPPEKLELPVNDGATTIDRFLLDEMDRAGLEPTPLADRRTLLRRVTLDLTGLPPTREEMQAFLSDASPHAYEQLVDRLLHSPQYAEQMARYWLDLVRYADTHGLHLDNYREMWPYRDWVIEAFQRNLPLDEFFTEQLAGDLLPDATDAQRIASGFNRLHVTTNEGGSIYDEVFARNVMDRTDAFGTVFLGLTTGCAACHDHKFDPISMRDYYALYAYFNSLDGREMDQNIKDPPPVLAVPDPEQRQQLADIEVALEGLRQEKYGPIPTIDRAQQHWERSLIDSSGSTVVTLPPLSVHSAAGKPMRIGDSGEVTLEGEPAAKETVTIVASLADDAVWQTLRLEALSPTPDGRVGASNNGNAVLSEIVIETSDAADGDEWIQVPIVHAIASLEQQGEDFSIAHAHDGKLNDTQGWAVAGHEQLGNRTAWFTLGSLIAETPHSRIRVKLHYQSKYAGHQFRSVRLSLSDSAPSVPRDQQIERSVMHLVGPFPVESPDPGYGRTFASQQAEFDAEQTFRYEDRTYRWQPLEALGQVAVHPLPSVPDRASVILLSQNLHAPSEQKVQLLLGTDDGQMVFLNGAPIGDTRGGGEIRPLSQTYELPLKKGDNRLYIKVVNHSGPSRISYAYRSPAIGLPERLTDLLQTPQTDRRDEDAESIRQFYRQIVCSHPDWLSLVDQEKGLEKAKQSLIESFPTTLIWKETETPRQAHLLIRGQYDQPGDPVDRSPPAFLPPLPADAPSNRLGLARWLTSQEHPLTARVAVNRFWQQLFGRGLVRTSEDFGSQGEPPSHPELLDWLAVDFREQGWDVRRLMKSLVMSEAYRRSSVTSPAALRVDPANRFLARGARYRLDAEALRDQALSLSGLLVDRVGGPSVKPPQPEGLWYAVGYTRSNTARFQADEGDKVYRRSLYTFWKRTSAPPQMTTFDAPSRESCTARRERTNTPLQALLMLNETQFLESSKHLAKRLLAQSDLIEDPRAQTEWLFETIVVRLPDPQESEELSRLFTDLAGHYETHPNEAVALVGESSTSLAAWTVVASTLLNLDEVVSK